MEDITDEYDDFPQLSVTQREVVRTMVTEIDEPGTVSLIALNEFLKKHCYTDDLYRTGFDNENEN